MPIAINLVPISKRIKKKHSVFKAIVQRVRKGNYPLLTEYVRYFDSMPHRVEALQRYKAHHKRLKAGVPLPKHFEQRMKHFADDVVSSGIWDAKKTKKFLKKATPVEILAKEKQLKARLEHVNIRDRARREAKQSALKRGERLKQQRSKAEERLKKAAGETRKKKTGKYTAKNFQTGKEVTGSWERISGLDKRLWNVKPQVK